jgi:hypothetical protein
VAAVSGKRGKRYLKRQQLLELGEPAIRYLTEIVHRAMEEGLQQQIFGAFYVERSLQAGLSFSQVMQ